MSGNFLRLWETKNKDDEWWSSFVTAPLGLLINYVIIDIKWITPNIITAVSFVTALLSALFVIEGGTFNFFIALFSHSIMNYSTIAREPTYSFK